jgi:hypothetical protein
VVFHVFADNDFGDILRNRLVTLDARHALTRTEFRGTVDDELQSRLSPLLLRRAAQRVREDLDRLDDPTRTGPRPLEVRQEIAVQGLIEAAEAEFATFTRGGRRVFSHFADHYDIDLALHPTSEAARVKVALMDAVLRKAKRTAADHGTHLLVLIQPSVIDVTEANAFVTAAFLSRYPDYRRDRLSSVVDDLCARAEIDRVNLFPVFTENDPDSLYFVVNDNHWNDRGQDLAARTTADHIQGRLPGLGAR